ncbi:MAG: DEAD/DEAH box helicase [Acutalibacteraceae bacterium]
MTFSQLPLADPLLRAVEEAGYTEPSPIQSQAIPPACSGCDLLGCAQTGTGKTAAFALPILQRLSAARYAGQPPRPVRALILTPTRELALQIKESFDAYGRHTRLHNCVIFGGVSQVPQVAALRRGVDILVATPGRLNDLIGQKLVDLSRVEIFVLDEADRMLDMGFIHDVKKVIAKLPAARQTMMFSATMPPEIAELADSMLHDPVKVAVTPVSSPVEAIDQSVYFVDRPHKTDLLVHLLADKNIRSALVFTRTKHGADKVARDLNRAGVAAQAIHGNKSQNARQQALGNFKDGTIRVLVATDIAARGIDVEELSHVVNYDLPEVPETYVHRIGRTGRAGHTGKAIAFCNIDEKPLLKDIEKLMKRPVPVVENHPYPMEIFTLTPKKQPQPRPARRQPPQEPTAPKRVAPPAPKAAAVQEHRNTPAPKSASAGPHHAAPQNGGKKRRRRYYGNRPGK